MISFCVIIMISGKNYINGGNIWQDLLYQETYITEKVL